MDGDAGPRGLLSWKSAGTDFPVNGFSFGPNGIGHSSVSSDSVFNMPGIGMSNLAVDGSGAAEQAGIIDMYWVYMAQYMEGGIEGAAAMLDVYASPSDTNTIRTWDKLKRALRSDSNPNGAGSWPNIQNVTDVLVPSERRVSVGSYRYAPSNIIDAAALQVAPTATGAGGQYINQAKHNNYIRFAIGEPNTITAAGPPGTEGNHLDIMRQNRLSDVEYPGSKVMFFMSSAWHNPDKTAWFEEGVTCTVALGDGSARATIPQVDGIPYSPNARTNAGPVFQVVFAGAEGVAWGMHYWLNNGGVKGREIASGG